MIVKFNIHYKTQWGQKLYIAGNTHELGKWNPSKAQVLTTLDGENWQIELNISSASFEYKYLIKNENGDYQVWEYGSNRQFNYSKENSNFKVNDCWRSTRHIQNVFDTSPFNQAFCKVDETEIEPVQKKKVNIVFSLRIPQLPAGSKLKIIGESTVLGEWNADKATSLQYYGANCWGAALYLKTKDTSLQYKYLIENPQGEILWEASTNRIVDLSFLQYKNAVIIQNDEYFHMGNGYWKAAGVAIPVFSLRTEKSGGVGEFTDIKQMVDWAKIVGLKLIQLLPVNDTIATKTWEDSYPYGAISVFALHPLYLNVSAIAPLKNQSMKKAFTEKLNTLNELSKVDYEAVLQTKFEYIEAIFLEIGTSTLKSKAFKTFFNKNQSWLKPYAAFCYLRDEYGKVEFDLWPKYNNPTENDIEEICDQKALHYKKIALYYFIQFYLDKQLKESTDYARKNGVVLKGDLPIGVYRYSVDAWINRSLYNMNGQAGAPPDHYSIAGQNWGFPTYNWNEMSKDSYKWWTERLKKLSEYFDVYRIDHILGFFRIWEIPLHSVEGLLGIFNPSIAVTNEELNHNGFQFDKDRFCKPYIREYMLSEIFGEQADFVKTHFLEALFYEAYAFKTQFDTQRKLQTYFRNNNWSDASKLVILNGLYRLYSEVLLLENEAGFHPRIGLHGTYSYRDLDVHNKNCLNQLYNHYFYQRHNEFWRNNAMQKLPALKEATNMLICGEDLGMVPESVPGVMKELDILSLEVHAMSKDNKIEFNHPANNPYLSVTTTSTHDSSTLRAWWEEDKAAAQRFFNHMMGKEGEAPYFCEPWIVEEIFNQHLHSPSMWAIFPLQDILALDGYLRLENPHEERINIPSIPKHYWRYRMHLSLESLNEATYFNDKFRSKLMKCDRL